MKYSRCSLIWGALAFTVVAALSAAMIYVIGKNSLSSMLQPLHDFALAQLENESRKVLTFREGYEGLRDIRIALEKNKSYTIAFQLRDTQERLLEAFIPRKKGGYEVTYTYHVPIHNLQSDISDLLGGTTSKATKTLGQLSVVFTYNNVIYANFLLFSIGFGVLLSLCIFGVYSMHQWRVFYKETGALKEQVSETTISLFQAEHKQERTQSILDRLFQYLETEFKRPADIIRRHKHSGNEDDLSQKALEKLTFNLETVLQARNKWAISLNEIFDAAIDVYAVGHLSCYSSLSLALEMERIRLLRITETSEIQGLKEDSVCLFDLDPMINNSTDIIRYTNLLPHCYKIGIFSGGVTDEEIYEMAYDVDWVAKDPSVSQIISAIKDKPKMVQLSFNDSL